MEKIVSFTENDKSLTQDDIAKLEQILGYEIDTPESFYQEPEDERKFDDLLETVLFEQGKAVWVDWRWDAKELFGQLASVYPQLSIKILSSDIENSENIENAVVHVGYEVDGETAKDSVSWSEPHSLVARLNEKLLEKTGTQLVTYASGDDEHQWFQAQGSFSEDDFNSVVSSAD